MIYKVMLSVWNYRLARLLLGGLFIWSGFSKLLEPSAFAVVIDGYGLIPNILAFPAAVGLSLLELVAGLGLIIDARGSLTIITGLLVLFVAVLGYGIWLGLDVDCGCYGPGDPEGEAYHDLRSALIRDLLWICCAMYLYYWRKSQLPKHNLN